MADIKLLALDLDDTLLDSNLRIRQRTLNAVRAVIKSGVAVTLATGRMFRSALPYARQLSLDMPLITYQGALVRTSVSEKTFYLKSVPKDLAKSIIREFRENGLPINIYLDDVLYVEEDTVENRNYAEMSRVEMHVVGKLDDFLDRTAQEPTKVLGIGAEQKLDDLATVLREKYLGKLYITKSKPYFLEVMHYEATKGNGLQAVAEHLGINKENVAAVGDSFNDLTMFDYAGWSVAMENAKDEIKRQVDIVTLSNDQEGVADFIEKYLLKEGR